MTQEGLPISHRVYPGNTGDPLTFLPMVGELKEPFGLPEAVIVADRGMFSAANVESLEESGVKYVLALRARQQLEGHAALELADRAGLPRPQDENAAWEMREVNLRKGVRHVVVYSAYKALHDRLVRARRLERTRSDLRQLQARAAKLKRRTLIERATRILAEHETSQYFSLPGLGRRPQLLARARPLPAPAPARWHLHPADQRHQAQQGGDRPLLHAAAGGRPRLSRPQVAGQDPAQVPLGRAASRGPHLHLLPGLSAGQGSRAQAARRLLQLTAARALEQLSRPLAIEHTWEDQATVVQATTPDRDLQAVLDALGIRLATPSSGSQPQPAA